MLNLLEVLEFDSIVSAVAVSSTVELMIVATADLKVSMFKFVKKEHSLALTLIHKLDLT